MLKLMLLKEFTERSLLSYVYLVFQIMSIIQMVKLLLFTLIITKQGLRSESFVFSLMCLSMCKLQHKSKLY